MIIRGDALHIPLRDESVHCVITSPPYWGLRDYGVNGQLGLEKTPDEYITKMVQVFKEVRRVLRKDGTLWVNIGDTYSTRPGSGDNTPQTISPINKYPKSAPHRSKRIERGSGRWGGGNYSAPSLKPKDLCMMPARLALALQADGWYLRSDIIWSKPNPMPESVTDRPTKAHEYVFLLSKSPRYFFDQEAVREKFITPEDTKAKCGFGGHKCNSEELCHSNEPGKSWKPNGSNGRNIRTVWEIATQPFSDAHFATFPEELVKKCLFAGCPIGGIVFDPFLGSGTVGVVAQKYNRRWVGLELKPEYCHMAMRRTANTNIAMI